MIWVSAASAGQCVPTEVYPQLHGSWRWVQTVDWFTETVDTPETVGHTSGLLLHPEGSVTYVADGAAVGTAAWCVRGCNIADIENFDCELGRQYLWIGASGDTQDGQGWHEYELGDGADPTLMIAPLNSYQAIHYVRDATVSSSSNSWGMLKTRY